MAQYLNCETVLSVNELHMQENQYINLHLSTSNFPYLASFYVPYKFKMNDASTS